MKGAIPEHGAADPVTPPGRRRFSRPAAPDIVMPWLS
jgi:hypothetical protein